MDLHFTSGWYPSSRSCPSCSDYDDVYERHFECPDPEVDDSGEQCHCLGCGLKWLAYED